MTGTVVAGTGTASEECSSQSIFLANVRNGALRSGAIPKAGKILALRAMAVKKYSLLINWSRSDDEAVGWLYQLRPIK